MLHHNLTRNISSPSPGRNSCSGPMKGLDGERAIILRRKRLRLRQIKSLSLLKSKLSVPEDTSEKRKRRDGITTPRKKLTENDVVVDGKSSRVSEEMYVHGTWCAHGSVSVIGRRREMEDAVASELGFLRRGSGKYDFFGVYDGHGGSRVSQACSERLHKLVEERVKEERIDYQDKESSVDWEKVMRWSFRAMDDVVNKDNGSEVAMMGSTAVVAVVGEEELVVANCGDSRAVLCRNGAALALSDDHKPDRADELERIQRCGGKVINWNGQRVLGVLSTSRSIGDNYLKPFVIPDPEVRVMKRSYEDEFLILASDGLWDVISNDIACRIVRKCLEAQTRVGDGLGDSSGTNADSRVARAAALLAELAMARGSKDNVSVIVIELKRPR